MRLKLRGRQHLKSVLLRSGNDEESQIWKPAQKLAVEILRSAQDDRKNNLSDGV